MQTLYTLLLVLQVVVAIALIGFILIQHGKGADAGAAFGSGASSTVFGSRGAGNFMTKTTTALAIIFLANSLLLAYLAASAPRDTGSLLDDEVPAAIIQEQTETQPVTDIPVDVPADTSATDTADVPVMEAPVDVPADMPAAAATPADMPADIPAVPQE